MGMQEESHKNANVNSWECKESSFGGDWKVVRKQLESHGDARGKS